MDNGWDRINHYENRKALLLFPQTSVAVQLRRSKLMYPSSLQLPSASRTFTERDNYIVGAIISCIDTAFVK